MVDVSSLWEISHALLPEGCCSRRVPVFFLPLASPKLSDVGSMTHEFSSSDPTVSPAWQKVMDTEEGGGTSLLAADRTGSLSASVSGLSYLGANGLEARQSADRHSLVVHAAALGAGQHVHKIVHLRCRVTLCVERDMGMVIFPILCSPQAPTE